MKIAVTPVITTARARYVRRTCLHRRPRGSKKTGELEADFSGTTGIYFQQPGRCFCCGILLDVYSGARVDSQDASELNEKSRPRIHERLSGELFGLTSDCDLRKEGATVTISGRQPNNRLSNPEARSQPPHCD